MRNSTNTTSKKGSEQESSSGSRLRLMMIRNEMGISFEKARPRT